jgi:hypothetical protein
VAEATNNFLEQRAPCFIVLVSITVIVSIPVAAAVPASFTISGNSL